MEMIFRISALQLLLSAFIFAVDEKSRNIYNYEPTSIPMPTMYSGYRLNQISRAASAPNLNPKFHPLSELFPDSQVYYYRMPVVAPYVYVSEFGGYVDSFQPFLPFAPSSLPIQLPLSFLTNGKPTGIHSYSSEPIPTNSKTKLQEKPTENQNSNVFNLNKGPYFLNGKATDIYLLQDTFNGFRR